MIIQNFINTKRLKNNIFKPYYGIIIVGFTVTKDI